MVLSGRFWTQGTSQMNFDVNIAKDIKEVLLTYASKDARKLLNNIEYYLSLSEEKKKNTHIKIL